MLSQALVCKGMSAGSEKAVADDVMSGKPNER